MLNVPRSRPESYDRRSAIAALVIVNALWGVSFPITRCLNMMADQHFGIDASAATTLYRAESAAWMIAIRFGLALVFLGLFMRKIFKRVYLPHVCAGVAIGFVFFLGLILQVIGLASIPASRSGFLTSLTVVFTPVIVTISRGRMPSVTVLMAAVVALTGVSILTGLLVVERWYVALAPDALDQASFGDLVTIVGAMIFSLQIILIDSMGKRFDSEAFTPSMFATAATLGAMTFTILRVIEPDAGVGDRSNATWIGFGTEPALAVLIIFLSVFPSLLAFVWMNKYQPVLTAGQAAVVYTLEPVFASLWAMVLPLHLSAVCGVMYFNEEFNTPLVIGGSFVLFANALALWPARKSEAPTETTSQDRS